MRKLVYFLFLLTYVNYAISVCDKFMIVTFPKNGTNLLAKAVSLIIGKNIGYRHDRWSSFNWKRFMHEGYKILMIIRDPRDRIISQIEQDKNSNHAIRSLTMDQAITAILSDFAHFRYNYQNPLHLPNSLEYPMLSDAYKDHVFDWLDNYPEMYLTKFEKLVGPKGGGTREEQIQEVINIAQFIEVEIDFKRAEQIADQLFGGTKTFRKGVFGRWKNYFTKNHKKLFKRDMGEYLILLGYEKDSNW